MSPTTLALTAVTIVLWGLIPIFDKLALANYPASPLVGIMIRTMSVGVLAVPLAALFGDGAHSLRSMPPKVVAFYVASGVASLLVSQYAYYTLLKQADVSRVFPLLFSAAPLVTILVGVLGLGETLTPKQIVGALLVIGGGILLL